MSASSTIVKVDLHVHTRERSPCATAGEEQQIRTAIAAGLDAIFITDHHQFVPLERLDNLNRIFAPFCIFSGIEVTSQDEDFIVLGVRDPRLETPNLPYPDLHSRVREHEGFIALAHPFRFQEQINVDLERFPPDAIELHSPNTSLTHETRIRGLADRLKVPLLSNSDAHSTEKIGRYYNILDHPVTSELGLYAALKSGRFEVFLVDKAQHG